MYTSTNVQYENVVPPLLYNRERGGGGLIIFKDARHNDTECWPKEKKWRIYIHLAKWDPLAHSVEYRSSDREVQGSGLGRVGGGVPHVQLTSEMLRLRGAEVERRVSRIYMYTNKNVCA